ncbi:protein MEI2-like 2 [Arachis duranensis]|uniref:Protein MEI2-like 2 n=1 Tax=Arachis duranensis TaxID=130453 RepID=A0A9C6WNB8_ARADU|nr:protein MEI2-like 2 [Arachis duranensis]
MIKSIPNKYTSKMLFAAIDENHHGTYDLMHLPIDFKNKCNVGYAFINMVSPSHMISFYEEKFLSSNLNVLVNQMGLTQVICWRVQRAIGTRN